MMNTNTFVENEAVKFREAETQGEIYQLAYEMGYDMEDFSDKYLKSDFCRLEMDSVYSKFQMEFGDACMDEVMAEFRDKNITVKKRDSDFLYSPTWIGEMYRYLFYSLKKYSAQLAEKIPLSELAIYEPELEESELEEAVALLTEIFKEQF